MSTLVAVVGALDFAARKHHTQRRKDAAETPYINHIIEVVNTLVGVGGVTDPVLLMAAALHDTVEDTDTSFDELETRFGHEVCDIVREVTDDKTLPKAERKRLQIVHAPHLSTRAKQLRLADKACNVHDVVEHPAAGWSVERRTEYLDWADAAAEGYRDVSETLEAHYDAMIKRGRKALERLR